MNLQSLRLRGTGWISHVFVRVARYLPAMGRSVQDSFGGNVGSSDQQTHHAAKLRRPL